MQVIRNKTFNIKVNRSLTEQYFNKKQNKLILLITYPKHTTNNTEHGLNVKKDYSYKTYVGSNYKSQIAYVEHNLYKRFGNIMFNSTNNMYKYINQYSTDVTDNYNSSKINNANKTYYNFNDNITLNKASNTYSNDTCNKIKTNNTFNTTGNKYCTKKIHNTSSITNDTTRHNHNNYEHNVIKRISKQIKHIDNYDAEMNYIIRTHLIIMFLQ